ncbi:MAG: phosphoribosylpyrophosphate synthetase [Leeuwenhoekiella sp.]
MKNTYSSLSVAIEDLQKKGYDTDFNLVDEGIESKHHKKTWPAEKIEVESAFRFEGMTDPGDNSVLYVINTHDGTKGLLVDAYGAYSGQISKEMIEKLRIEY